MFLHKTWFFQPFSPDSFALTFNTFKSMHLMKCQCLVRVKVSNCLPSKHAAKFIILASICWLIWSNSCHSVKRLCGVFVHNNAISSIYSNRHAVLNCFPSSLRFPSVTSPYYLSWYFWIGNRFTVKKTQKDWVTLKVHWKSKFDLFVSEVVYVF